MGITPVSSDASFLNTYCKEKEREHNCFNIQKQQKWVLINN